MHTVVEYCYRDAGNFKSFGFVALEGVIAGADMDRASRYLSDLFIAEQIGVPPLYDDLYRWSGGPTASDHCWHEFVEFRMVPDDEIPERSHRWGDVSDFIDLIAHITVWDEALSPHATIGFAHSPQAMFTVQVPNTS